MANGRKTTICREAWYCLAVLLIVLTGAMLRQVNLLFVLAGMIAGPLLLSWRWVAASLAELNVERELPKNVCAGDTLVGHVKVTNGRRRRGSWAIVVEERIERAGEPAVRPYVYFPRVPAGQTRDAAYRGRLPRRGRYAVGPFQVSTRFPFGLFRRAITLGPTVSLVVFPRLGRLAQGWIARQREAFEGAKRRRQRYDRVEGEFYGVRDWQTGDSRRTIHWRSSARRGGLVVRRFDQPHNQDIAVLVDLWRPVSPGPEDLDRVELAVSFAATVVADVCRKGGGNVLLGTTATPSDCVSGPASIAMLQDAMEQLAVAEAANEDRLLGLLSYALGRIAPGSDVVLITTRSVDLSDDKRFGSLWRDPAQAAMLRQVQPITTSESELARYFQVE
jgi:uncharacterized protein (DUF58 family)